MLTTGAVLQRRYLIKGLLREGGMGAVYDAEATHLGNIRVAVKETFYSGDIKLREQFQREASMLARLRHHALPHVSDHFIEGEGQFLVMDFIPGEDLGQMLNDNWAFDLAKVLKWADTLLDALNYIHTQHPAIIHRDIKPQNIKVTPEGNVFLIDFGLAKSAATVAHSDKSIHAYTLGYASPEQLSGTGTDQRSDIYSLGATLYHLLTGQMPADSDSRFRKQAINYGLPDPLPGVRDINPKIPVIVESIIKQAMDVEPDKRFASAAAMRKAFQDAESDIVIESLHVQPTNPLPQPDTAKISGNSENNRQTSLISDALGKSSRQPKPSLPPFPDLKGNSNLAESTPMFESASVPDEGGSKKFIWIGVAIVVILLIVIFVARSWKQTPQPPDRNNAATLPSPTESISPSPTATQEARAKPSPTKPPQSAQEKNNSKKDQNNEDKERQRQREAEAAYEAERQRRKAMEKKQ